MSIDTFADRFLKYLQTRGPECAFQVMLETSDALERDMNAYERICYDLLSRKIIEPASRSDNSFGVLYQRVRLN